MSIITAFWDASALVPLCVMEPTTDQVQAFLQRQTTVVWWSTTVEIQSAIAQRYRLGHLDHHSRQVAIDRLFSLRQSWQEILPSMQLRDAAEELLYLYSLRAADSLQLAAAMIWCRQKPSGRKFIASDARLCAAASQIGFQVIQPGVHS